MKLEDLLRALQEPDLPDEYTKRQILKMPVKFYTGPNGKGLELLSVYINHDLNNKAHICVDIGTDDA